jgi:chaperone modulatory protein CbpM
MTEHYFKLSLTDICVAVSLPEAVFVELVQHDIVRPLGAEPAQWEFDTTMLAIAQRAARLHRDLELDWAAVAIVEKLIEQREQLQSENQLLRQQLDRFLDESRNF